MSTIQIVEVVNSVVVESSREVIVVGIAGPQGPPGSGGAIVDALADRPLTADEGALFAATDTEQLFIWFAA